MLALIQFVVVVLFIWAGWKLLFPKQDQPGDLGSLIRQKRFEIQELQERRERLESEIGMNEKLVALDLDIEKAMQQLEELEQQWKAG